MGLKPSPYQQANRFALGNTPIPPDNSDFPAQLVAYRQQDTGVGRGINRHENRYIALRSVLEIPDSRSDITRGLVLRGGWDGRGRTGSLLAL